VRQQGVGLTVRSFSQIGVAVGQLLPRLEEFQRRAATVENRAALEVPQRLAAILKARRAATDHEMAESALSCD
jgi:hypothetical protein